MFKQLILNYKKKSLNERFLLFIGVLFLMIYLTLGVLIIFWRNFPMIKQTNYRIAFGFLIIIYSIFRFWRLIKTDDEN